MKNSNKSIITGSRVKLLAHKPGELGTVVELAETRSDPSLDILAVRLDSNPEGIVDILRKELLPFS